MKQKLNRNIILIGFMGSGKTSVGERLAKRLSYQFLDTDQLLEQKAGVSINRIFEMHGEEHFRNMETELLNELLEVTYQTVLSTGGGMPLREQNSRLMKELGYVVYLKASKETTVRRLMGDSSRPLLKGEELSLKVEQMLEVRTPVYEKAASGIVVTDDKTVDEIVTLIMADFLRHI